MNLSRTGRTRVALITAVGTLACMAAAVATVSYTTRFMPPDAQQLTWASAFIIPIVLSMPIFYYFASTLRRLAIAHEELARIAARDSLTTCYNRGAFLTLVEAYLRDEREAGQGAMLVIDADHFKSINDRFGHAAGDQALKLIVAAVQSVIRPIDLLGRIGGEEFAIFLPKVDADLAAAIAERVRQGVNGTTIESGGRSQPLSVSVGAVVFSGRTSLDALLAEADAMLYAAKNAGRNRVAFAAPGFAA